MTIIFPAYLLVFAMAAAWVVSEVRILYRLYASEKWNHQHKHAISARTRCSSLLPSVKPWGTERFDKSADNFRSPDANRPDIYYTTYVDCRQHSFTWHSAGSLLSVAIDGGDFYTIPWFGD